MENKNTQAYYLGLDMGTSSVGWAVTDEDYHLLRAKGKDLWGIRSFEEAKTSAERRTHRIARRRREREIARIGILKELFADEIAKVDANFYQRLDESKYHLQDKQIETKYSIFADKDYTDKEYYKNYPTIFHLRKKLVEEKDKQDIRLIYLALLNMFKHRGHFLNNSLSAESKEKTLVELYRDLKNAYEMRIEKSFSDIEVTDEFEKILSNRNISRTQKRDELLALLQISKKEKDKAEILGGIAGLSIKLTLIFGSKMVTEENKALEISFRNIDEEKLLEIKNLLDDEENEFLDLMKIIHDQALLASVMKGYAYLSQARVASYNKHKEDLYKLKLVIRKYLPNDYDDMFRNMTNGSYSAYVNSTNSNKKLRRNVKDRKREKIYDRIKKLLKDLPQEDEDVQYVLAEISKETFLPKQLTPDNGIIPNQVHQVEMKVILENAEQYYSFLKEKDESDLTVSEKIIQLFTFTIPYYVGPLRNEENNTAWVVRKEKGKILPWNFEEKISVKESAEEFIKKMTRKCTYLQGQTVLPKNSLLYEKFCVLNELNNLKIAGERIDNDLKKEIYHGLFFRGKKVTKKSLFNFLKAKGILADGEEAKISGIDGDFKNTLSSWKKFSDIFGENLVLDSVNEMVEQIIFWSTIYGEDKKFLKEKIKENYEDLLDKNQLKKISSFKFKDWGNLSKEFLELVGCDKDTGESLSLISQMWESNKNLMELLSNQYTYLSEIKEKTQKIEKTLSELEYEDLEEFCLSAPVKRMVWQTLLILKEIQTVLKKQPKKIFVEMAREDGEKGKRTISRKNKLLALYKKAEKEARDFSKEIKDYNEDKLRSKKLYLYYIQKGRCMYTGENIELDDLFNGNLYDIDHIYPRHYVKDDNIENNLVLVKKEVNGHKSDSYPLEELIYKKQGEWWKILLKEGFINQEKYNRLTGRNPFTDEQLSGFIARQLVETRQGTKAITQILEQSFSDTEIVYVKAGNVSEFRKKFKLLKSRIVNDFHHAHDAYLNIVVGNVYQVKFTKNPMNFIKEYRRDPSKNPYHLDKIFNYNVNRNGESAWSVKKGENSIETVKKMLEKNTPLMTRMNFEVHGQLSNQTLYGAIDAKRGVYIPLKESDKRLQEVERYGGFCSVKITYFFLVEHEVKKNKVRTIEAMPLYLSRKIGSNRKSLEQYCRDELKLKNPDVRLNKIKIQSLVKKDGYFMHISGKSGNRIVMRNATSLCLQSKIINYIRKIENSVEREETLKEITLEKNEEIYNILLEKHKNTIYAKRPNSVGEKLDKKKDVFLQLESLKQCKVLLEMLKLTHIGLIKSDLTLIKESTQTGIMCIGKDITKSTEFLLINQSPTGLYEEKIDLLKV